MIWRPLIATGIINPIEAKVRKGKGAVGAYGNERTKQSLQDFPVVDSEEEEEKVEHCFQIFSALISLEKQVITYSHPTYLNFCPRLFV